MSSRARDGIEGEREARRLQAVHCNRALLDQLAAELGSPAEWLATAIVHLKVQTNGINDGTVDVSAAAVHLVLMHLEVVEHGGAPWRGGAA